MRGGVGKATLGGMRLERKPGQSGEGHEALVLGQALKLGKMMNCPDWRFW